MNRVPARHRHAGAPGVALQGVRRRHPVTFGHLTCSIKFVADAGTSFPAHRIVDDLRGEILAGGLAPGGRLPSEHELALRYGTSRPTVRRAIARLKAEGLVVTEQGRGAFVRPEPHVRLLLTGATAA